LRLQKYRSVSTFAHKPATSFTAKRAGTSTSTGNVLNPSRPFTARSVSRKRRIEIEEIDLDKTDDGFEKIAYANTSTEQQMRISRKEENALKERKKRQNFI